MISDYGNIISSIKFTLYMNENGVTYIHLAAKEGSLPNYIMKKYTVEDINDIPKVLKEVADAIYNYESKKVKLKNLERREYMCLDCNTLIPQKHIAAKTQFFNHEPYRSNRLVLACPHCDSTLIKERL